MIIVEIFLPRVVVITLYKLFGKVNKTAYVNSDVATILGWPLLLTAKSFSLLNLGKFKFKFKFRS